MITKWSVPGESRARSGEKLQQRTGKDSHHDPFSSLRQGNSHRWHSKENWNHFTTHVVSSNHSLNAGVTCIPALDATWNLGNTGHDRQQGLRVIYRVVLLHGQQGHGTATGDHRPASAATIQTIRILFQTEELRTAIRELMKLYATT